MLRKEISLVILFLITGCSSIEKLDDVIPDNRTEYQKSKSLPLLEIPPDLTSVALDDPLAIPGEENAATLSEFKKIKTVQKGQLLPSTEIALSGNTNENWLATQGTVSSIWPKLREFWLAKGFFLDIDDAELGVLETEFKDISVDGVITHREKFRLFSEAGRTPDNLILLLESKTEKKNSDADNDTDWIKQGNNDVREKELVAQLDLHLNGTVTPEKNIIESTVTVEPKNYRPRAELVYVAKNKQYLVIPNEFSSAWRDVELAIKALGLYVENQDREQGIYSVLYYSVPPNNNEEGMLKKLAFWKDGDNDGKAFKINLVGVGNKTEIIVLDVDNNWSTSQDANHILEILQNQYNSALN